jgi:putative ABC transport system permease protein
MSLYAALRVALESLVTNKGRTLLTSLGIIIGISAVIAMVTAGSGARAKLDERLDSVGKNMILITPGARTKAGVVSHVVPISPDDIQALRDDRVLKRLLVGLAESQPMPAIVTAAGTGTTTHTTLVGTPADVFVVRNWQLAYGRFYTEADGKKSATVCVIGETVRRKLFPGKANPVGEKVRTGGVTLEIVGLVKPKGLAPTGFDQDNEIMLPLSTLQDKIAKEKRIGIVVATAKSSEDIDAATDRISKVLREKHRIRPGEDDDFTVSSVQEMSKLAVFLANTLNVLVVVIASISLVVGGIGIMNIMLVSVTERTREIGIRMAVGATPSDVRTQFLIESVAISLTGGLVGVLLGIGFSVALTHFLGWPVTISPFYVALAFGVSALVGMFFGSYPAAKAAELDPIEALRYE